MIKLFIQDNKGTVIKECDHTSNDSIIISEGKLAVVEGASQNIYDVLTEYGIGELGDNTLAIYSQSIIDQLIEGNLNEDEQLLLDICKECEKLIGSECDILFI